MTLAPPASRSRAARPLWLATPGRWVAIGRSRSRVVLALLAVLVLAALLAGRVPAADPIDGSLGAALADGVRNGGDFYAVARDAAGAVGLPLSPHLIPLPTLFLVEGHAPTPIVLAVIMLLAVAVVIAWYARFGGGIAGRRVQVVALLLMLLGVAVVLRPALLAVPEGWAGLLVALSLARARPGRMVEPAALGLAAATLSPAALPYAGVMAAAALLSRTGQARGWREAGGWLLVLLAGAAMLALHAHALAAAAPPDVDPASAGGIGPVATIAALGWATGLRVLSQPLVTALVPLAALGWASWREPAGARVAALLCAQAVLIAVSGQANAALIVAPLLPLGLLALPDLVRALLTAALDRRRITVTRLAR